MNYNDMPEVRATTIKAFASHSPMTAKYILDNNEDKPHYAVGRLVHSWLETGSRDLDGYVISPFDNYRTKEARMWRDEQIEVGITPLKASEFASIQAMVDGVISQTPYELVELIRASTKEEIFTFDNLKAQLDVSHDLGDVDWKTCAQVERAERDFFRFKHYIQAYHYRVCKYKSYDLADITHTPFYFAYIGKAAPYETLYYRVTDEGWQLGKREWEKAFSIYNSCLQSGVYPNRNNNEVMDISVPSYLVDDDEGDVGLLEAAE